MGRELFVALFVVAMSCGAFAQSNVPVVTPTATPLPPTPVKNFSFVLYDTHNSSAICLRMTAAIVVNVTYIDTDGKNISKTVAVTNQPSIGANSMCDISATKATLMVTPDFGDDEMGTYWITFTFTGDNSTGNNHWSWSNISFTLEREYMENYAGGAGDDLEFNTTDALHEEPNSRIEFERSYQCVSNQILNFTKANQVNPFVYISQLQVQAFHFKHSNGSFDDARVCLLDTAGKANKIVPIAVGAALAGLVVVVLIAYLIGRLRSRRQSSYEALS